MKVDSSAALGTLTVTAKDLSDDPTLQFVIQLANSLQLTVKQPKKGPLGLELPSGTILSQRNAILRCLAGMGLHNALDDLLSGGHSKAAKASPAHAMALASLSSWMSVADHYRTGNDIEELLELLEKHLETRAFLIPSAVPTLADVDVATVVAKKGSLEGLGASYPNVDRWLTTVGALLETKAGIDFISSKLPVAMAAPPMFFFGDEEGVELPSKPQRKPAAKKEDAKEAAPKQQQQQQKGKKSGDGGGKQPKEPQQAAPVDISALDIRVGKILKAWPHPEAEKLYCEEIDVGEEQPRQIASGLRPFYATADDLVGKTVMVLCNLKSRKLVGFPSHGMVMCASNADHTAVETMEPPADAKIGERIMFEGYEGEPEAEAKVAKKKIFEAVAPDLKTNAEGICVWKGAVSKTSGGPVKASKGMADAHVA
jgi:aminoacyl tRNA synthase complex-interacting multifunctional protein 1